MDRKQIIRWLLDLGVVIGIAFGGFLFGRIDTLQTVTAKNSYRLETLEASTKSLADSVDRMVESIDNLASTQESLILVTTFRADPWSGAMMDQLQREWYDIVNNLHQDAKLQYSTLPDVKRIQRDLSADLVPPGLKQ